MSVYVDDLRSTRRSTKWPYDFACHMMADSVTELHLFARLIGLKVAWFQKDHYDLTAGKRWDAIARGANPIGNRDMVLIRKRTRSRATTAQSAQASDRE